MLPFADMGVIKKGLMGGAAALFAVMLTVTIAFAATTYTDSATGAEFYATSTHGVFSGVASGSLPGLWYASVLHTPLSGSPQTATVTGGSFSLGSLNGQSTLVTGTFASGGSVVQTGGLTGCTDQTYQVVDRLTGVGPYGGSGHGTGRFDAVLTHYRQEVAGYCITYSASVNGTIDLSF